MLYGQNLEKMRLIFSLTVLLIATSCSSPQKLVNRAIKKDPFVLHPYVEGVLSDLDTSCVENIVLKPRPVYIQQEGFGSIVNTWQQESTNRTKARQSGRTDRVSERQETNRERASEQTSRTEARQEGMTNRTSDRQSGSTDRVVSRQGNKTEQLLTKEKEKTKRWFWLSLVLIIVAFFMGRVSKGKEKEYGNFFRRVWVFVRRLFIRV